MLSLRHCVLSLLLATSVTGLPQREDGLVACGEAFYAVDKVCANRALFCSRTT